jgi:alkaline phosphatase
MEAITFLGEEKVRWSGLGQRLLVVGLLALSLCVPSHASDGKFKNVIIMVADGTTSAQTTAARWYKGAPLALDAMALAGVRTYSSESLITDSAPAATAFATGHKSSDNLIGVLPESVTVPGLKAVTESQKYKPVPSVLEGARLTGRSVGLVATANIQHATPAAFSAHWPDRSNYNEIAEQQVYCGIDVVLGGGKKYLLPKEKGGGRTDEEDLVAVIRSRGYAYVESRDDMITAKASKLWGMFADEDMAYDLDRTRLRPTEPSLAEMTKTAIDVLAKNRKGFFLFVEGSKVDWAAHANDPVGVISDLLAFDEALAVALDYAKRQKGTLVLALSDHGTGGMTIESFSAAKKYSELSHEGLVYLLKKARLTGEGIERMLAGELSEEKITSTVAGYYGVEDLKPEEITAIQRARKGQMNHVLGTIVSRRSNISWATRGHTGEDLFFYHYGLGKSLGMLENTDIARMAAHGLGFDLESVDRRLFVKADEAFASIGARITIDKSDAANPVLVVKKGGKRAELPFSKDLIKISPPGAELRMEGRTVFSPKTGAVYVPGQAVTLFEPPARKTRNKPLE